MEVFSVAGYAVTSVMLICVAQYFVTQLLVTRLRASVKNEYDEKLEQIKFKNSAELEAVKLENSHALERMKSELKLKEQSAVIAALFAEWLSDPDDRKKLNELTMQATLWLPDHLVREIAERLAHQANAPSPREIVASVRRHLHDGKTTITSSDITLFPPKSIVKDSVSGQ